MTKPETSACTEARTDDHPSFNDVARTTNQVLRQVHKPIETPRPADLISSGALAA